MRIVVDTNVIVSALVFGGVPRRAFEVVQSGYCELYYSADIESKTRRGLHDKFGWNDDRLNRYLPELLSFGQQVTPRRRVKAVRDDPDDNRILECAVAAEADFIVSGDDHLLKLSAFEGIAIFTPREFLRNDQPI